MIASLAPVLVRHADRTNLPGLSVRLAEVGLSRRLAWLVDSILEAIRRELTRSRPCRCARRLRRAEIVLNNFLEPLAQQASTQAPAAPDILDLEIRSARTLKDVSSSSSPQSKRWGVVTRLLPEDFVLALQGAR